jgi:hypothetical protein
MRYWCFIDFCTQVLRFSLLRAVKAAFFRFMRDCKNKEHAKFCANHAGVLVCCYSANAISYAPQASMVSSHIYRTFNYSWTQPKVS